MYFLLLLGGCPMNATTVLQSFCYIQKIRIKENGVHYALRFLMPTK